MKILFITNRFNPPRDSGSAVSSSLIYDELKKRGHEVDLLIFDYESKEEEYRRTSFRKSYKRNDFLSVLKELSKLEDGIYDIIHQYGGGIQESILPYATKNFKKTKVVTTYNGVNELCWNHWNYEKKDEKCCKFPKNLSCAMEKRKMSLKWFSFFEYIVRKIQNKCGKRYDKFFALSKGVKNLLVQSGFKNSDIKIVPNFYDPDLYQKFKKFDEEKQISNIVILYVGSISPVKGVEDLLRASKKIKKKNIEIRLMGDGLQKEELEKEYGMDNRIKFLGRIPNKSEEFIRNYMESDISFIGGRISAKFWIPHAFGRTFLEAALARNAIVAAHTGEEQDLLENKALLYEINDIDELANKLKLLINNPEKRNNLANAIHEYVLSEFSVEKSIDKLEREYMKLLEI